MNTSTITAVRIASLLAAAKNCERTNNREWRARHQYVLDEIMRTCAPSGSGIDTGTKLRADSTSKRLRFDVSYHHIDHGCYSGWSDHVVSVGASLVYGLDISISGSNRADIKTYLHEVFDVWLNCHIGADIIASMYSAAA